MNGQAIARGLLCVWGGAACALTSSQVKQARGAAYQTGFEDVWTATLDALRGDYPLLKELDPARRRIVTCWRPIDRDDTARSAIPGSGWRLYRATVTVSSQPPFQVSVVGRAAEYYPPVLKPLEPGDLAEPGWTEGRTDRIAVEIHERLNRFATAGHEAMVPGADSAAEETTSDTCIIRPEIIGVDVRGMQAIAIGDPGVVMMTGR
jgi:hypothetical protein